MNERSTPRGASSSASKTLPPGPRTVGGPPSSAHGDGRSRQQTPLLKTLGFGRHHRLLESWRLAARATAALHVSEEGKLLDGCGEVDLSPSELCSVVGDTLGLMKVRRQLNGGRDQRPLVIRLVHFTWAAVTLPDDDGYFVFLGRPDDIQAEAFKRRLPADGVPQRG